MDPASRIIFLVVIYRSVCCCRILIVDNDGDATNPTPKLKFKTTDLTSGISHYFITINDNKTKINTNEINNKGYYQSEPLSPGEYMAEAIAVDLAGNSSSSTARFIISPLKAPIITDIPKVINKKNELIIRGTSFYSNVTVKLYIGRDNDEDVEEYSIKTDDNGEWSYFHKGNIEKGNYEIWAKIIDDRGAQSLNSSKHLLTVVSPSIICSYGLWIILFLLVIIVILLTYILYQRKEFKKERIRIKIETEEMKKKLSKIFNALREEINELISLADKKKGLSESERRVKEKLQESLDISEEFIDKEVQDIEKEIKLKKIK